MQIAQGIIQSELSMITEILRAGYPSALNHAVDVLRHGGLVAFPTDTVYGLAALPFRSEFVEGLFSAKGRNNSRAIAILIGNYADLDRVVEIFDEKSTRLASHFWPGPLTLVVPKHSGLPEVLSPDATIGVRMPDHPVALALLRKTGPLAVTSANISGQENAHTAEEVNRQLNGRVHLILDGGRTSGGVPSTVVNCSTPTLTILREGPISLESIESALAES
jgi:L-threonylcarbamoyladenylate synthase